jgi:hypothetical protein
MAGIAAGTLLSPLLLAAGMNPLVTVASTGLMVMFTSSSTAVQYLILGRLQVSVVALSYLHLHGTLRLALYPYIQRPAATPCALNLMIGRLRDAVCPWALPFFCSKLNTSHEAAPGGLRLLLHVGGCDRCDCGKHRGAFHRPQIPQDVVCR